jgi:hypothetical protein
MKGKEWCEQVQLMWNNSRQTRPMNLACVVAPLFRGYLTESTMCKASITAFSGKLEYEVACGGREDFWKYFPNHGFMLMSCASLSLSSEVLGLRRRRRSRRSCLLLRRLLLLECARLRLRDLSWLSEGIHIGDFPGRKHEILKALARPRSNLNPQEIPL